MDVVRTKGANCAAQQHFKGVGNLKLTLATSLASVVWPTLCPVSGQLTTVADDEKRSIYILNK